MLRVKFIWKAFVTSLAIYGVICLTNQVTGKAINDIRDAVSGIIFGPDKKPVIDVRFEEVH